MSNPKIKLWQQIGIEVVDADSQSQQALAPFNNSSATSPPQRSISSRSAKSEAGSKQDKVGQQKKVVSHEELGIEMESCESEEAEEMYSPKQTNHKNSYSIISCVALKRAVTDLRTQTGEMKNYVNLQKKSLVQQLKNQWSRILRKFQSTLQEVNKKIRKDHSCPNCTQSLQMVGNINTKYEQLQIKYEQREKELEELRRSGQGVAERQGSEQSLISKLEMNLLMERGDKIRELKGERDGMEEEIKELQRVVSEKNHEIKELQLTYRVSLLELRHELDRANSTHKQKIHILQSEKQKILQELQSIKKEHQTIRSQNMDLKRLHSVPDAASQSQRMIYSFNHRQFQHPKKQNGSSMHPLNRSIDESPTDRSFEESFKRNQIHTTSPIVQSKNRINYDIDAHKSQYKKKSLTSLIGPSYSHSELPDVKCQRKPITHSTKVNKTLYLPLYNANQAFSKLQRLKQNVRRELKRTTYQ